MDDKTRIAIEESIKHHLEMQKWVKSQDMDAHPNKDLMLSKINQNWDGEHCSLCQLFYRYSSNLEKCANCPLGDAYGICGYVNVKNAWHDLAFASDWKEWLKADRKLVRQLRSLL